MSFNQRRVFILLMDSFGIGQSLDADKYGDVGADTFGHIYQSHPIGLKNLAKLGLFHAHLASTAKPLVDISQLDEPVARYGYAVEQSYGKDTPSGHWEIAGLPVMYDWGYFNQSQAQCFPKALIDELVKRCDLTGVLGEKHASGTEIIKELGQAHIDSLKPIVYTSADSVFQIAAHETHFGLEKLYQVCEVARVLVDQYQIGRVIARPFVGDNADNFKRTGNRKDYATPPHDDTLLDKLVAAGREVISIGKIADIFAHRGISQKIKANGNEALFQATIEQLDKAPAGSLVFTNFVDFDSLYGHRRDIQGYANALEIFDNTLAEFINGLKDDDMLLISADHGCDPSFKGSDHTREHVPVLCYGKNIKPGFIGRRESFADMGQSIAEYLGIDFLPYGISFLPTDNHDKE